MMDAGQAAMAGSRRIAARAAVVAAVSLLAIVLTASASHAHGPTPDGTNYRSTVTGVVATDGAATTSGQVTWRVLGGDALLQVRNTGDQDVVVAGYDGEPFVRVGPSGVFENHNSPATYLNADRFGNVPLPPDVDAEAAPDWRKVNDAAQWQWHDHRIHWMAPGRPPQLRDRPDAEQHVLDWSVPFSYGGRRFAVHGALRWIPPVSAWPWVTAVGAVLSLPVVMLLAAGAGDRRVTRTVIVLMLVIAAGGVLVAVGDAVITPTSVAADASAVLQAAAPAVISGALAWALWNPAPPDAAARPEVTIVVAALIIAVSGGVTRLGQLVSSQVVNALPTDVVRAVVAASLAVVVPAIIAALARRPSLERTGDR